MAADALSTDGCPEAMTYSVPQKFQLQRCKGKAPAHSQGPTTSNTEFQSMYAQILELQQEKEAVLVQVQKLQN